MMAAKFSSVCLLQLWLPAAAAAATGVFGALKQEVTLCHVLNKLDLERETSTDRCHTAFSRRAASVHATRHSNAWNLSFLSRSSRQDGAHKPGDLWKRTPQAGDLLSPAKDKKPFGSKNGCNFGLHRGVVRRIYPKSSPETQRATDECEYRSGFDSDLHPQ